ncbi:hypothetical protein N9M86_04515 [Euryarchaeota archaeon]|nr:hypothetical protein [Euryarchaeota archaeon]
MTGDLRLKGVGVFPLTASKIEKFSNLTWEKETGEYIRGTNPNWEWQRKIGDAPVYTWFPKYFSLPRTSTLEVLETQYAEPSTFQYEVDREGASAGEKLKIKKPWVLKFKNRPDWLDTFAIGGKTRWGYKKADHQTFFLMIFLSNDKVDIRLLTKDNLDMLDDFDNKISDKIREMFSTNEKIMRLFVREINDKFEWV